MKNISVIIAAAGSGSRMGGSVPKQYLMIEDLPVLVKAVRAFCAVEEVQDILVMCPPGDSRYCQDLIAEHLHACTSGVGVFPRVLVREGGATRQQTVEKGMSQLSGKADLVLVHDGARPFVSAEVIGGVIEALKAGADAAVPCVRPKSTIRTAEKTLDRSSLYEVQTPQGFKDPQGTTIEDPAVINWLSDNGFTQADIDALGNNYAALEKFYEAYIVNYDFRVQGAGVALSFTDITVGNDNISVTVQLVRTAPLGAIHGKLYFYGATDLTAGFGERPIVDTSVSFGETDETFDTTPTQGTVTQTATATLTFVSDKFFKAQIHAELPDNGE